MNLHQSKVRRLMNDALDWWVYGSFHIAFCVFAFATYTYLAYELIPNYYYLAFISNSTFLVYSCHKLLGIKRVGEVASRKRFRIVKEHTKHIIIYVLTSLIIEFCLLFMLSWNAFLLLSLAAVTSILYISPILPKRKRLRDFWYIKIFLIAGVFGFVCAYIPLHNANVSSMESIPFSFMQAFFVFGLTIPFDVRDIEVDKIDNNVSLATYFGKKKSILLSLLTLFGVVVFSLLSFKLIIAFPIIITSFATCFLLLLLYLQYKVTDLYYTFLLDGMLIFPSLTYLFKHFLE